MFQSFEKMGKEVVLLLDPTASLTLVAGFQAIIVTWATVYIMYIGYMSLLGKIDNPVRQVIYKMLMFMFISLFAFNMAGWYTLAIDAINGLVSWISGGGTSAIFKKLDDGVKMIANIAQVYEDNDSSLFSLKSMLASIIIYIAYFSVALLVAILLVLNVVSLHVIIVLAPFAFLSLFFPLVRGIFDRWIELIISNLFTIFFISLFFNAIYVKYESILAGLDPITIKGTLIFWNTTKVDIFLSAFAVVGFSVLSFMLLMMSVKLASKLSSVSIESLPSSAAVSTVAAGYIGTKAIANTVGSVAKGSGKVVSAVSGVSRAAGSRGGSKAQSLLKKRGKKGK